jgi:hypothetical protein
MPRAYVDLPINTFLSLSPDEIMGQLSNAHSFDLDMNQKNAWQYQIQHLQHELSSITKGKIFLEFSIPRMGKRADVILLLKNIIFILEYKVGSNKRDRSGLDQVHDYALDLKNFHLGSHLCPIVPILIPTATESLYQTCQFEQDKVASPITISPEKLFTSISETLRTHNNGAIIPDDWSDTGYKPTPTIIEAAEALFAGHSVKEITRSESGAINLEKTASASLKAINEAKVNKRKSLIFITGVPGSGKTLAGLEIATSSRRESCSDNDGVFLTGNGPLADVLREALARDEVERTGVTKADAMRKAKTFIQNVHHFRDEYLSDTKPPCERVVVFDEAQRAWNLAATQNFMRQKRNITNFDQSEPEFLLSVMARHPDWCVVICLIGNGQEINSGEAGVSEWIRAAEGLKDNWNIYFSDQLYEYEKGGTSDLFENLNPSLINQIPELHLKTSIRSFRSEQLSEYVGKILDGDAEHAKKISYKLGNYPLFISRNFSHVKSWLKTVSRGSERYGLVSSSNAIRLKPYGLHMKSKIDPANWFLADKDDIRSSYYLEDAASEFDIQGLELDWIGLCWDANLRKANSSWNFHNFVGTRWQNIASPERKLYLINSYRVLMTRARQGMVIFIPEGDQNDITRKPEFYDPIYDYLLSCGFNKLVIP